MKKTLMMLGIGVAAGVVAYAICKRAQNGKNSLEAFDEMRTDENLVTPESVTVNNISVEEEMESTGSMTMEKMKDRHDEAVQIMEESARIICKRSEVSENEMEDLEELSKELDNLLGEE